MKLLLLPAFLGFSLLFIPGCASEGPNAESRISGRAGVVVGTQNMSPFPSARPGGNAPMP